MIVKTGALSNVAVSSLLLTGLLGASARADTMLTTFATFMHAGPAKQFAVTDEIPTRTAVDLQGCANGWCQVRYGAAYGWVEQKMLAASPPLAGPPSGARASDCFDFVRTGWPDGGDLDRLCIYPPTGGAPPPELNKQGG